MKGYVFTYGVDGFGADVAPAHEIGVYLDFEKAFAKLVELNHKAIKEGTFVSRTTKNEKEINKEFINADPWYDMYALEEIEIIE